MEKTNQERLKEINDLVMRLKKEMPEEIDSFLKFMSAAEKGGAIDVKNKALINTALAVAVQCEWCIALHVKEAVNAGATKEEILEAAMQAVLMHGGPALMYMIPVENAIKEYMEEKK